MNSIKVDNPKGYLEIVKGFNVSVYKKPKRFHLFMMRLFFGWKYKENKTQKVNFRIEAESEEV